MLRGSDRSPRRSLVSRSGARTSTRRTASLDRGQQRVRDDGGLVHVDAAVRFDGAVVVERQLGSNEPVVELARLDGERLHVAGDLFTVAEVRDLERGFA